MASMYSAKVMEHFANPHNVGEIPDANGVGEVGNPKCGDIMRMYLKIKAVVEALEGLPPIKVHCSVLAEQAVKSALSDYYRRQGIDPEPIVGKLEEDCDHCSGESCGH